MKLLYGVDVFEGLKTIPDESVNCCVTSPPYWGLRDYGEEGQLGLEKTPDEYVAKMVKVFREVRRVLKDDGTLWLNLGDSYSGSGRHAGSLGSIQKGNKGTQNFKNGKNPLSGDIPEGMKPKDLVGIPWMVAFALRADGWYLRQDIIWHKPNPMPESVTDRCTKCHEYVFLLSKSSKYYFDNEAIKENAIYGGTEERCERAKDGQKSCPTEMKNGIRPKDKRAGSGRISYGGKRNGEEGSGQESFVSIPEKRNKRSVWTVTTKGYPGAHFATFPQDLIIPMIQAGTSEHGNCLCGSPWIRDIKKREISTRETRKNTINVIPGRDKESRLNSKDMETIPKTTIGWKKSCGCLIPSTVPAIVLDPFSGSGTTGEVALNLGRDYIGIDLNKDYEKLARERFGLFA